MPSLTASLNRWPAKSWVYYALLGLACLLVWGRTVSFQFVWDDHQFILDLQSIRSLKNVPQMFYSLAAQSSLPQGFVLFRPLRTLHYALLYWVAGQPDPQPWIYHLANVLWHTAAVLLLFSVLTRLYRAQAEAAAAPARLLALLIALGFAVHPVVSEVVCWAKSLDDLMATVFTLAATRALLCWDGKNRQWGWALFYFVLALYSKESAAPFPAVVFLLLVQFHRLPLRQSARRSAGFVLAAVIFLVHRHLVIGRTSQTAPISGSYGQTLIDMFPVVAKYLRLLCGVPPFTIDYSYLRGHYSLLSPPVLLGATFLFVLAALGVWAWRRRELRLISLGLCWLGLFLLPVANLLPMMQYMAERFLYLPLIGWLLAFGAVLQTFRSRRLSLAAGSAAVLLWAGVAWQRSAIWKDELTLFVRTSREAPRTARVEQNALFAIFHMPQIEALFSLNKNGRLQRTAVPVSLEAGQRALNALAEAHRLFPQAETVCTALGMLYAGSGQDDQAIHFFELAVERNARDPNCWSNLGIALLAGHQPGRAREALEKSLALDPGCLEALRAASSLYWQTEDFRAALKVLKSLQQLEPDNADHARWIHEAEQKLAQKPEPVPR